MSNNAVRRLWAIACCLIVLPGLVAPRDAAAGTAEQSLITHYYQT